MAQDTIIGLKNLRENMDEYISKVRGGKSFVVIKKSKPVFKITPLDEWGDDGLWETVIDFTKTNKKGIVAKEILKYL